MERKAWPQVFTGETGPQAQRLRDPSVFVVLRSSAIRSISWLMFVRSSCFVDSDVQEPVAQYCWSDLVDFAQVLMLGWDEVSVVCWVSYSRMVVFQWCTPTHARTQHIIRLLMSLTKPRQTETSAEVFGRQTIFIITQIHLSFRLLLWTVRQLTVGWPNDGVGLFSDFKWCSGTHTVHLCGWGYYYNSKICILSSWCHRRVLSMRIECQSRAGIVTAPVVARDIDGWGNMAADTTVPTDIKQTCVESSYDKCSLKMLH